jgi:hypothetical protein
MCSAARADASAGEADGREADARACGRRLVRRPGGLWCRGAGLCAAVWCSAMGHDVACGLSVAVRQGDLQGVGGAPGQV